MKKHVISVGFSIPGQVIDHVDYGSNRSLLDADLVVFSPNLHKYSVEDIYQGKNRITDTDSPRLVLAVEHWRKELELALVAGKTIFVFLWDVSDVYVSTGDTRHEGTGRLARILNLVQPLDPYSSIPIKDFESMIQRSSGSRIRPTKDIGVLAPYWQSFGPYSTYDVYLLSQTGISCLVTRSGDRMVGGIIQFKDRRGVLILLPPLDFEAIVETRKKQFAEQNKGKTLSGQSVRSPQNNIKEKQRIDTSVGNEFVNHLIEIDQVIRDQSTRTPPPDWAGRIEYRLEMEQKCFTEILALRKEIDELNQKALKLTEEATAAGSLRGLLFESGKALEAAIIEALGLLGFKAENFTDGDSEFDIVFEADGMRFIGEAEGKNDKAINIDKLAQLERNIQEDFEKQEDKEYSKPVLFGNAYRLLPPAERNPYFTEKCIKGAKRAKAALVRTPDLFTVVKNLKEHPNENYAALCRAAIRDSAGEIVQFPSPPSSL